MGITWFQRFAYSARAIPKIWAQKKNTPEYHQMGQALVVSWYHLRKRNGNDYYQLNTAVLSFHTSGFFFILFLCYRFYFDFLRLCSWSVSLYVSFSFVCLFFLLFTLVYFLFSFRFVSFRVSFVFLFSLRVSG